MKIEDKSNINRLTFGQILPGTAFRLLRESQVMTDQLFIKIEQIDPAYNSIDLNTGLAFKFSVHTTVYLVNAKVVIE